MSGIMSLAGAALKFGAMAKDMEAIGPAIVAQACKMVCDRAKEVLGTYEFNWPHLQAETIAHKMRGDSPLLETGELRHSIQWTAHGNEGPVGSNLDRAVWMEFGTSRIPPRPFLSMAAQDQEKAIHTMAVKAAVVDELGLFFAGEPDDKVERALATYRRALAKTLAPLFAQTPADQLEAMLDCLIDGIQQRRRQIEASGPAAEKHETHRN